MRKERQKRPFIFGRVFFPGQQPVPDLDEVRLQPLGDHVGNVIRLVKQWKEFPCGDSSRKRVIEAAKLHDMGKPQAFSIQVPINTKEKFINYIYSFRGHRFLAKSDNQWEQMLARGHHDFSVGDIIRDTYELKKINDYYFKILSQDPLAYAEELYILEMCDQIEAELACRVLDDDYQAESRTFMDYTLSKVDSNIYQLDPWPFTDSSLQLSFHYWSKSLSDEEKTRLRKLCDQGQAAKTGKELDQIVKDWWHQQKQNPKAQIRKITLQPFVFKGVEELDRTVENIYQDLAGFLPNPMQSEMFKKIVEQQDLALLLKAPTGSGKTEAVLFPALTKGYRLFLPLPTRSLLEDQRQRVSEYLIEYSKLPENSDREVSLVVDTGSQMYRWVYKNGRDITSELKINLRRHLYKGDVVLTTVDKFLYRYFAFGDKQKSFIFPLRINQKKTLICFDEVHTYDDISFTNFQSLVKSLYEAGRSLVLMTATMPQEHSDRFDYLDILDYTDKDNQRSKNLNVFQQKILNRPHLDQRSLKWDKDIPCHEQDSEGKRNSAKFQQRIIDLVSEQWGARHEQGRILVVVQTVKDAVQIYSSLNSSLESVDNDEKFLFLYHGRIADQKRPEIYKKIKQHDQDSKPYIIITTSAIEVGCDLNAEVLISQICSPENLIQRVGRCNRKGDISDATVIVVGDRIPDYVNTLDDEGWKTYQNTLNSLTQFDAHSIAQCIRRNQHIDDYRVIELFSMLHDYVYGADLTCYPTHKRGLIPTRSWTPSATLEFIFPNQDKHSISVPIDRLCNGTQFAGVNAYELKYDSETTHWADKDLGWGEAYNKQIKIKIFPPSESIVFDASLPNYQYDEGLGFVELPKVFTSKWVDGSEVKLLYVAGDHKSIITYVKSLEKDA